MRPQGSQLTSQRPSPPVGAETARSYTAGCGAPHPSMTRQLYNNRTNCPVRGYRCRRATGLLSRPQAAADVATSANTSCATRTLPRHSTTRRGARTPERHQIAPNTTPDLPKIDPELTSNHPRHTPGSPPDRPPKMRRQATELRMGGQLVWQNADSPSPYPIESYANFGACSPMSTRICTAGLVRHDGPVSSIHGLMRLTAAGSFTSEGNPDCYAIFG